MVTAEPAGGATRTPRGASDWRVWCAVAVGGAAGATARYGLVLLFAAFTPGAPWATLAANLLGTALIGATVGVRHVHSWPEWLRAGITAGLIGTFTTFSALIVETLTLWRQGAPAAAGLLLMGSLAAGVAAWALANWVARSLGSGGTKGASC